MKTRRISKVYFSLSNWRNFQFKLFSEGIIVGILSGITVVAFRYALEMAETARIGLYSQLSIQNWHLILVWFGILIGIAYILNQIVVKEPSTAGSGIPQVKGTIMGLAKINWARVLIGKFIGGTLAIGAGLSLGREGPSVQLGASIGQGVSRLLRRTRMEERFLLTSGAGAGLAAAFNAPLAGVIFALEELHKNFSSTVFIPTIAATLTANVISHYFFGNKPIFQFLGLPILPEGQFGLIIIMGVFTGLSAVTFNRGLMKTLDYYDQSPRFNGVAKIILPLIIAGIAGFILPDILGGGNELVNKLAETPMSIQLLSLLLIAKYLFTLLSYGSGVPGGIFLPMLVLGALTGGIFGEIAIHFGYLDPYFRTNILVFSMAAYFSAVVKSPVTASILIMEMTASFNHMLPVIIASITAYLVADLAKTKPIYEELLERSLQKQGKNPTHIAEKNRLVLELVVCSGSQLDGKLIRDISWPPDSLLVNIKRGNLELVPSGDSRLITGDYLYILTNPSQTASLRKLAEN